MFVEIFHIVTAVWLYFQLRGFILFLLTLKLKQNLALSTCIIYTENVDQASLKHVTKGYSESQKKNQLGFSKWSIKRFLLACSCA